MVLGQIWDSAPDARLRPFTPQPTPRPSVSVSRGRGTELATGASWSGACPHVTFSRAEGLEGGGGAGTGAHGGPESELTVGPRTGLLTTVAAWCASSLCPASSASSFCKQLPPPISSVQLCAPASGGRAWGWGGRALPPAARRRPEAVGGGGGGGPPHGLPKCCRECLTLPKLSGHLPRSLCTWAGRATQASVPRFPPLSSTAEEQV